MGRGKQVFRQRNRKNWIPLGSKEVGPPRRLLERGNEWILETKSELVALLSGVRRLPLKVRPAHDVEKEAPGGRDSAEHTEAVLALAQRLRQDGLDAWIDQYANGTP
jgi:hypothetical protein